MIFGQGDRKSKCFSAAVVKRVNLSTARKMCIVYPTVS